MEVNCSVLWKEENAHLRWAYIAGKLGASPELPRPFLIALRGAAPGDSVTHRPRHYPEYRDSYILICKGEEPIIFKGSTVAYQRDSKESPDENKDGRGDVGSIRPGSYVLTDTKAGASPIFLVHTQGGSAQIPCYRDMNHNGVIEEDEIRMASEARTGAQVNAGGYYATSVLMHEGFPARSSIACLTTDVKSLKLLAEKAKYSKGKLDCVLTNAWIAVPLAEEFDDWIQEHLNLV